MKISLKKILVEKRPLLKFTFFLLSDAILMFSSVFLAFLVRFEGQIPIRYFNNISGIIILLLIITLPIFYFSKLYYFSWLYVSTTELISLAKATFFSFLILATSFVVLKDQPFFYWFPPLHFVYHLFFCFFALRQPSLCQKSLSSNFQKKYKRKRKNLDCRRRRCRRADVEKHFELFH